LTNAKLASETIYDQQTAATNAKNKMPEVVAFSMIDEMKKWGQGTQRPSSTPFRTRSKISTSARKPTKRPLA
jgi:hypothetical protein